MIHQSKLFSGQLNDCQCQKQSKLDFLFLFQERRAQHFATSSPTDTGRWAPNSEETSSSMATSKFIGALRDFFFVKRFGLLKTKNYKIKFKLTSN